jgi:glycosyltransferase involved in cell wall biosynthesis
MKVLHITNNYPTDKNPVFGIFVKEQIESLTNLGIANEVFFINGRENGKWEYLNSIIRLRKYLKGKHFDVVHCHHTLSALCFILSGCPRRQKSVVSYQCDPSDELGGHFYPFITRNINFAILKNNSPLINNSTVFNQPNGVNINFFKPIEKAFCCSKLNLDVNNKYILFVSSNFNRMQKRYDRFKKTLEILRNKYKTDNVVELLLINTERQFVPLYFNAASMHLLTSDFEGSPNSVKEAIACNIPVVSTDVGNVSELLSGCSGFYMAKTKEPEELAELAYRVLTDTGQINSRNVLIEKELDAQSVANKIVSIYEKVIKA